MIPLSKPPPDAADDYDFWPQAMLPAWFVTDHLFVIKNTNEFADELVSTFGVKDCSTRRFLVIGSNGSTEVETDSLLNCIVDPSYKNNLAYIRATSEILQEHLTIFQEFNDSSALRPPEYLIEKLKTVPEREGVKPYVYSLATGSDVLRMGLKVSPPQGLKLARAAEIENAEVEFVDVVMAYRLRPVWSQGLLKGVLFFGVQPAIHDATERHHMWEKSKEEEEAKITQFLSHALNTPLANTQSILNVIKLPGLDPAVREERIRELESIVTDVDHLVGLLLFINTTEEISAPLRLVASDDDTPWARFAIKDIESVVASALQSVHNRRTGNQVDVEKIESLFISHDMPVPSHEVDGMGIMAYKCLARAIISSTLDFGII